ncbi:MAG: hypothetical protein IJT16_08965 [Lachnospiraceae bacterium]|nr:hypothetical protein [Lachnospiraceae bacterium]
MKKRLLTGILTMLFAVSLTACGDSGDIMEVDEDMLAAYLENEGTAQDFDPGDYIIPDSKEDSDEKEETKAEQEKKRAEQPDGTSHLGSPWDVYGDEYFGDQEEDSYGDVFDLREYEDEWIKEYGGNLENLLAERLNTEVETSSDGESKLICDGAIEFFPAVNGSGFFVWVYEPVNRFSVYGISVGMTEDNAIANLEANGLSKKDDGDTGIYSTDFDKYYVRYNVDGGTISQVTYIKIYER